MEFVNLILAEEGRLFIAEKHGPTVQVVKGEECSWKGEKGIVTLDDFDCVLNLQFS